MAAAMSVSSMTPCCRLASQIASLLKQSPRTLRTPMQIAAGIQNRIAQPSSSRFTPCSTSRQQLDVPVEITAPALVQIVRRKRPPMLLQLPTRRADRVAQQVHVRLRRRPPALLEVARGAGGGDIFPHRPPAMRAGDHMVERQLPVRPA